METFDKILQWLGPASLLTAVLTYVLSIRQRKFELKQEHYKRVRVTVSSLFMIWKDYSALEKFLKSEDQPNLLLYNIPGGPMEYLKIDQEKIDRMTLAYNESIENLKDINTYLFYRLNDSLSYFLRTNEEVFEPLLHDEQIEVYTKREVITEVLDELLEDLEGIIKDSIAYLPFRERRQMKSVMKKHLRSLTDESEVPGYFVKLLESKLSFKASETEITDFFKDPTITWLIEKMFSSPELLKVLSEHKIGLRTILDTSETRHSIFEKIGLSVIMNLRFTEDENIRFVNNRGFYHQLLGLVIKIDNKPSIKFKKILISLDSGDLTPNALLESIKASVTESESVEGAQQQE